MYALPEPITITRQVVPGHFFRKLLEAVSVSAKLVLEPSSFEILLKIIAIERVGVEEIKDVKLGQTLSVCLEILGVVVEGPFDMLPMVIERFVEVVSEGFFSLVN